jgi:hypothetical protein
MPWGVKHSPQKGPKDWAIVKKTTGEVVGRSTTKKKAQASIRARFASEYGHQTRKGRNAFGETTI